MSKIFKASNTIGNGIFLIAQGQHEVHLCKGETVIATIGGMSVESLFIIKEIADTRWEQYVSEETGELLARRVDYAHGKVVR